MQFNSEADSQDLVSDTLFLLGGLSTTEYTAKNIARNMNERYRQVWQWIFASYGGWEFLDDNTSDTSTRPLAAVNLTSGTAVYALPSGSLTVNGVEVQDDNSTWFHLSPTTYEEIRTVDAVEDFHSTDGVPRWYVVSGDIIELFPAPNFTKSSGLRVYFSRDVSTFASTDTTKTPGFASPFHRVLSVGAALDFALANGLTEKINVLTGMWIDYERRIKEFYSQRFKDKYPPRIVVKDSYREFE